MTTRRLLAVAWIAARTFACSSHAAPVATNIAGICALDYRALTNRPAVRASGILTAQEPGGNGYLQDQGWWIRLAPFTNTPALAPGTRVDVEGVAGLDQRGLVIQATRIEPRGDGPLPAPQATHLDFISQPVHHGRRVRVEGIVVSTSEIAHTPGRPPEMFVVLATPTSAVGLRVQGRAHDAEVASWVGTPAWVTGVAVPVANPKGQLLGTMLLVTPKDSLVPMPTVPGARQDWPLFKIHDLLRPGNAAAGDRPVRIQGTVTAVLSPFFAFIQDDTSGILLQFDPFPIPLRIGQSVKAEGFPRVDARPAMGPGRESAAVVFRCYRSWSSASQPLPAGIPAAGNLLGHSWLNFRRITTEGRVQAVVRQGASNEFRISLLCGNTGLDVLGSHPSTAQPLPNPESMVRVTGVLDQRAQVDKPNDPILLYLADIHDITVVAPPPRDTTRDLAMAAVPASALALLALGWAFALRRAVRRRTAKLAAANASLAQAGRARADFLTHMSHEVRTPVHAMNGLLQLLSRLPLADQPRALVQRLATTSRSLAHLVNDALDLSKIDAGQLVLDPQPFHPNALLDHLDGLFAPLAHDQGLAWSVQRLPAHAPHLVGDAFRLQQVLCNLASNAIKFTRHGHVRLLASLAPATPADPNGPQVLSITCEDSGVGIAPETLRRLFQPYSQADASTPRTHGGSGLGLAIARQLVQLMGGTLHAESQPGAGSRFQLLVPLPLLPQELPGLAPPNGQPNARPSIPTPQHPRAHRLAGRRILVADDHPTNLGILEAALGQEDACALLVPDGLAALHAIESDPSGFDALVIDLEMPVMDGLEAMRRIRRIPGCENVPIVACSAGIRAERREAARAAGATTFLSKPFDLDDLVATLAQFLPPDAPETHGIRHPTPRTSTPSPQADATATHAAFPNIEGHRPPRRRATLRWQPSRVPSCLAPVPRQPRRMQRRLAPRRPARPPRRRPQPIARAGRRRVHAGGPGGGHLGRRGRPTPPTRSDAAPATLGRVGTAHGRARAPPRCRAVAPLPIPGQHIPLVERHRSRHRGIHAAVKARTPFPIPHSPLPHTQCPRPPAPRTPHPPTRNTGCKQPPPPVKPRPKRGGGG